MSRSFVNRLLPCLSLSLFLLPAASMSQYIFTDIAEKSGVVESHLDGDDCYFSLATGSAWADVDNDSDIDLYVTSHGGPNQLYLNQSAGIPDFVDMASEYGVELADLLSNGVVFVDYDNDGDQDLFVMSLYGNTLFANQLKETGSLGFTDVTAIAGIADGGRGVTAAWGDYDQDGFLDLYVTKHKKCGLDPDNQDHLFHNEGDGTFTDVCAFLCNGSSTCEQLEGLGFSAAWIDYDNDGDSDLYVANDSIVGWYPNVLWRNDGDDGAGNWVFTDVSDPSRSDAAINSMGLGVADYDNDGWFDFAISNIGDKVLLKSQGNGTFREVAAEAGVRRPAGVTWGTVFFDYNNDGWEDLFFANGSIVVPCGPGCPQTLIMPNMLHENNGDGTFKDVSARAGLDDSSHARAASIVDFDGDGFVDLLVSNLYEVPLLYRNRSAEFGNTNHWLTVTVEGSVSNRDGIGSRLMVATADSVNMMREITSGPTHGGGDYRAGFIGLGTNDRAFLSVRWPGGIFQTIGSVQADQQIHLVEPWPVSVDVEVSGMYDPVPDSLFPVAVTMRNHSTERYENDLWMTLRMPDGRIRDSYVGPKQVSLPGETTIEKLPEIRISPDAPEGEYWLVVYLGTYPDSVSAVDSIWFSKESAMATGERPESRQGAILGENYPNPFNPSTTIDYELRGEGRVSLKIYNTLGQEVSALVDGLQTAGKHSVVWNGRDGSGKGVASGIYISVLRSGSFIQTRKLLLLK